MKYILLILIFSKGEPYNRDVEMSQFIMKNYTMNLKQCKEKRDIYNKKVERVKTKWTTIIFTYKAFCVQEAK